MVKLEENCYRIALKPAIKFGIAGLGQAGGNIADLFASLKNVGFDSRSYYEVITIDSFRSDPKSLKSIVKDRKLQLIGGEGCRFKPEFCYDLMKNPENQKLVIYLFKKYLTECDVILFTAGLGRGTGSGLLATSIQVANYAINKPLISQGKRPIPIGAIITLPRKTDPVIEKRNTAIAIKELKDLLNKGLLRFCIVIDNDKAFMDYKDVKSKRDIPFDNWMDYTNHAIVSSLHEFNIGISNHSNRNFSPRDMKNIFEDNPGCLSILKLVASLDEIQRPNGIIDKITKCLYSVDSNVFANGYELKDITHAGFLLVKPKENHTSNDLIDEIDLMLHELMPFTITRPSSCISGNKEKDSKYIIYIVTKVMGFPNKAEKYT